MFDQLERYLSSVVPYERASVILTGCRVLADIHLMSFEDDIEEILLTLDNSEHTNNVNAIETVVRNYLEHSVNKFAVEVEPETPMDILCVIIKSLFVINSYGDKTHLLTLLQMDMSNEEKLVEILTSISSFSWQEILPFIKKVNPNLLGRIEEELDTSVEEEPPVDLTPLRERFGEYKDRYTDLLATELLHTGTPLGTELGVLTDRVSDLLDRLDRHPEALAKELIGLVLFSDTPNEKVLETVQGLLEDFAKDINVTTKAHSEALKILKG